MEHVIAMSSMFEHAPEFNHSLNLWSTGQVTDMSKMFEGARSFNQNINTWNTVEVTDMSPIIQPPPSQLGYKPGPL